MTADNRITGRAYDRMWTDDLEHDRILARAHEIRSRIDSQRINARAADELTNETMTARANDIQRRIAEHHLDAARIMAIPPSILSVTNGNVRVGYLGDVVTAHAQVTANLSDAAVRDELIRQGWTPPGQERSTYSIQRNAVLEKVHTNVAVKQVFEASNRAGTTWLQTVETIALHMITSSEQLEKELRAKMYDRPTPAQMMDPNEMTYQTRRVPDSTGPRGYREEIVRQPNIWHFYPDDTVSGTTDRPPGTPRWR